MQIELSQADIDNGVREDCARCPLALALQRQTGLPWEVGCGIAWINRPGCDFEEDGGLELCDEAAQFESDFDAGLPVKPFSFNFPFEEEKPCASK